MSRNYKLNNPSSRTNNHSRFCAIASRSVTENHETKIFIIFVGEEDCIYSSAVDYSGEIGMIDNVIVVREL